MISYLNSISSCPPTHNHFTHLQPPQLKFPPGLFSYIRLSSTERQLEIKNPTPSFTRDVTKIQTLDLLMKHPPALLMHNFCRSMQTNPQEQPDKALCLSTKERCKAMLLPIELMEIQFLGEHKSLDTMFFQQVEGGKNINHKSRKWSKGSHSVKNANRTTVATHVGASWPKGKKDPILLPRIQTTKCSYATVSSALLVSLPI